MACMPFVGFMLSKVEARWLVAFGMAMASFSLFQMSHFSLAIDYRTALTARMIQALGLAFLFIPINTISYAMVPQNKRNQASGLINLARNLGGSVGIAYAATMLTRYAQRNQSILSAHMTATSPAFQSSLRTVTQTLRWHGETALRAAPAARGILYGELVRQSTMLAYAGVFRLMAFISLAALALVFLLKKNRPIKGPVSVH